jgi:hypothetical protein
MEFRFPENQPIIMIIKAVCDSVDDLVPISELPGD